MTTFRREAPAPELSSIIECFWSLESDVATPELKKIIPDAFTELIFHFADPYRIKLGTRWEVQSSSLLAGQISKHFYLENTGTSEIFAIKLKPSAIAHLFGIEMHTLTDRVVEIKSLGQARELRLLEMALRSTDAWERRKVCEDFFMEQKNRIPGSHPVDTAVSEIFGLHGVVNISTVAGGLGISDRYLEQLFRKFVGLSPKFFSRIVRFNHIFHLVEDNDPDWSDVVFQSGFYDQSHFIRNFKAFTGEDPTKYGFDKKDMANFFLKGR